MITAKVAYKIFGVDSHISSSSRYKLKKSSVLYWFVTTPPYNYCAHTSKSLNDLNIERMITLLSG